MITQSLTSKGQQLSHSIRVRSFVANLVKYVVLILAATVCLLPISWIVFSAFKDKMEIFIDPFGLPSSLKLDNLITAWTVGRFGRYFMNSIIMTIPTVFGVLALSALGGFATAKLRFPGREVIFSIFLVGLTLPFEAIMIPLYYTLRDLGILSTYWAVILPSVALGLPFGIFFMRAFFRDLPDDLIDASLIDGCTELQLFTKIMLPLAKPGLVSLLVFQFMWSWNNFLLPLLFLQKEALRPVTLGLMFFQGKYTMDYSLIFSGITISIIPVILVYIIFQRQFITGLTSGTVKG